MPNRSIRIFLFFIIALIFACGHTFSHAKTETLILAVTGFQNKNLIARLDPLREAIPRMLATDLSLINGLRVVERSRVDELLKEKNLSASGLVDPDSLKKAGKALGADYILSGAFRTKGESVIIESRIYNMFDRSLIDLPPISTAENRLIETEKELVKLVCSKLKISPAVPRKISGKKIKRLIHLAIMDFDNLGLSDSLDHFKTELPTLVAEQISTAGNIALIERSEITRILDELALSKSGMIYPESAAKAGKILGADLILFGWFFESGSSIRIDAELVDPDSALVVSSATTVNKIDNIIGSLNSLSFALTRDIFLPLPEEIKPEPLTMALETLFYLNKSMWLYNRERYEEAIEELRKTVYLDEDFLQAKLLLAESYYEAGNRTRAIPIFEEIIRKYPAYYTLFGPDPLLHLAELYRGEGNPKAINLYLNLAGKTSSVWRYYHPGCSNMYEELARSIIMCGRKKDVDQFVENLKINPPIDLIAFYCGLGKGWQDKKKFDNALNGYHKALELYSRNLDDFAKQESLCQEYYYELRRQTAEIYRQKGDYYRALQEYEKISLELTPGFKIRRISAEVVKLCDLTDEPKKAKAFINKAETVLKERLTINNPLTVTYLGRFYAEHRRYDEAIALYKEFLEKFSDDDLTLFGKAEYKQILLIYLARCYRDTGKTEDALNCYREILKSGVAAGYPTFVIYRACLDTADILYKKKDYQAAIPWYRRILTEERSPKEDRLQRIRIREKIADCYRNLGQPFLALHEYGKASEILDAFRAAPENEELKEKLLAKLAELRK